MKMLFRLINQAAKIKRQRKQISTLKHEQKKKQEIIDFLYKEISRRDQKIIEQQKRLRFFGIEIGNEDFEVEKLDFPNTIKI